MIVFDIIGIFYLNFHCTEMYKNKYVVVCLEVVNEMIVFIKSFTILEGPLQDISLRI